MRIADRSSSRSYLENMTRAKNNQAKTNEQISSQNRFESISEDPSAGVRVMQTRMGMYTTQVHLNNVESINDELTGAEDAMSSMEDLLSDAHALVLKGLSEDKAENGQEALANEIKSFKDQILKLANSKYDDTFTFGGSNASLIPPFTTNDDGRLEYNGVLVEDIKKREDGTFYQEIKEDDGTGTGTDIIVEKEIPMDEDMYMDIGLGVRMSGSQIEEDTGFKISFSGLEIMGFGDEGNIYNVLHDIESALRGGNIDEVNKLDTVLVDVTDDLLADIAEMGSKTNYLSSTQTRLELEVDNDNMRIHNLMGTDMAEAATELMMNDMVLKAVMQMGSHVLPTSLMDFL